MPCRKSILVELYINDTRQGGRLDLVNEVRDLSLCCSWQAAC